MADSIVAQSTTLASIPDATRIATDDAGASGHVQIIKLALSADGSASLIAATTDGLLVQPTTSTVAGSTSLPAGTNNIGDVDVLSVVPGTSGPALGKAEDSTHASGDVGVMMLGVRSDTPAALAGADGDYAPFELDSAGRVHVMPSTDTVAGSTSLPAGTNNIGDIDVLTVPTDPFGANADAASSTGSISAKLRFIAATGIPVTGTVTVQAAGDVAHDAADSGNPLKIGARAATFGVNPTAVATSDRTDLLATRQGMLFVIGGHPFTRTLEYATTAASTDAAVITAASTGVRIVVTQAQGMTDEVNTTAVGFRLGFSTGVTPTTTGVILTHPGLVPGAGVSRGDGGGIIGSGLAGENVVLTNEIPTGGAFRALLSYFQIEST